MPASAASRLVTGPFDEAVVRSTVEDLRSQLADKPTFALAFVTPDYAEKATEFLELVRVYGHVADGGGLHGHWDWPAPSREQEEGSGFSLMLVSAPGAKATAFPFKQDDVEVCSGPEFWRQKTGLQPADVKAWLVFPNPFSVNVEAWLKQWNQAYPRDPDLWRLLAGGFMGDPEAWVFCDDQVVSGGVAVALQGDIAVHSGGVAGLQANRGAADGHAGRQQRVSCSRSDRAPLTMSFAKSTRN